MMSLTVEQPLDQITNILSISKTLAQFLNESIDCFIQHRFVFQNVAHGIVLFNRFQYQVVKIIAPRVEQIRHEVPFALDIVESVKIALPHFNQFLIIPSER